ncbi:MAG: class I SAM-dependent methyltransferase [Bacteroidota bacterium]
MNDINTLEAYEKLARSYSEKIDYKPHNAFYDRPNTLSLLPEEIEGKLILDAGCGPGKYSEILLTQGATVIGVDLSPKMIEEAMKRNGANGEFMVHDLTQPLDFADGLFDIIICPLVLEYILHWRPVFKEFNRILKRRGTFVFSVTHPFFDYTYFNSTHYFKTEKVSATWTSFGEPIEVESFRRSLTECVAPLIESGFMVDKILEPRPVKEFEQYDPKHFKELNEFPAFLCIRAVKAT